MPTIVSEPVPGDLTEPRHHRLGTLRVAVTGAIAAAALFALCWLAALILPAAPTHRYIGLFTAADMGSTTALVEGFLWSLVAGFVTGAVVALAYNVLAPLERRSGL